MSTTQNCPLFFKCINTTPHSKERKTKFPLYIHRRTQARDSTRNYGVISKRIYMLYIYIYCLFFSLLWFAGVLAYDDGASPRLGRSRIDERVDIDRATQSGEHVVVVLVVR